MSDIIDGEFISSILVGISSFGCSVWSCYQAIFDNEHAGVHNWDFVRSLIFCSFVVFDSWILFKTGSCGDFCLIFDSFFVDICCVVGGCLRLYCRTFSRICLSTIYSGPRKQHFSGSFGSWISFQVRWHSTCVNLQHMHLGLTKSVDGVGLVLLYLAVFMIGSWSSSSLNGSWVISFISEFGLLRSENFPIETWGARNAYLALCKIVCGAYFSHRCS